MVVYGHAMPDMNLVAIGVVIWVVAVSIAFGAYLPFLRASQRGASRSARAWTEVEDDLDHAVMPGEPAALREPAPAVPSPSPMAAIDASVEDEDPGRAPEAFSVLIVDDNAVNRQVLELILDSVGMAHVSVVNGLEAVEAMRETAFDAVLMDLQMPVMDGFEATRRIREMEARRAAPHSTIIVVSANCLDEHVQAGREAGADAHLAKPISAGALIGELAACPTLNRMAA